MSSSGGSRRAVITGLRGPVYRFYHQSFKIYGLQPDQSSWKAAALARTSPQPLVRRDRPVGNRKISSRDNHVAGGDPTDPGSVLHARFSSRWVRYAVSKLTNLCQRYAASSIVRLR